MTLPDHIDLDDVDVSELDARLFDYIVLRGEVLQVCYDTHYGEAYLKHAGKELPEDYKRRWNDE